MPSEVEPTPTQTVSPVQHFLPRLSLRRRETPVVYGWDESPTFFVLHVEV
jgi:hypothetical protein